MNVKNCYGTCYNQGAQHQRTSFQ